MKPYTRQTIYKTYSNPVIHESHGEIDEEVKYVYALSWNPQRKLHTIHGLWPLIPRSTCQLEPTSAPLSSEETLYNTLTNSGLVEDLTVNWPSTKGHRNSWLWYHEWSKHGSKMPCHWFFGGKTYRSTPSDYFEMCLKLYQKFEEDHEDRNYKQDLELHFDERFVEVERRKAPPLS